MRGVLVFPSASISNIPAANISLTPTKQLFVDGQRTDTYTANGTLYRPFKTIGAAVSQIITNGDNSTNQYNIQISPGAYSETITLNNSLLFNIIFSSNTGSTTPLQNVSVNGLTSTSNNTQLATVVFNGITFDGNINLTGDINNTNFASAQVLFSECMFNNGSGTFILNNINNVNFYSCQIQGTGSVATFTNVAFAYMEGAEGFISGTTLHLVQNDAGNQPSQTFGNYLLLSDTKMYATVTIDAESELDSIKSYFGSTSSTTNNGTIHSWNTSWGGALTLNNGSLTRVDGDIFTNTPTINSGATVTNRAQFNTGELVVGSSAVSATNTTIVTKDGHIKSTQTTAPTAAPTANAGTGATCTVSNATDISGTINLTTTATTPASGAQCNITFNKAYNVAPICIITPANANAAQLAVSSGVYVTTSTSAITINFASTDSVGHTYIWEYHCIETQ